jgi:hypothetical protein
MAEHKDLAFANIQTQGHRAFVPLPLDKIPVYCIGNLISDFINIA